MEKEEIKEALNNTKDSVSQFIDERFKTNYFYSSFIIAWLVINWKAWYVTIFENSKIIPSKIEYLITYFKLQGIADLLVWPFCYAFGMIIFLPALGFISRIFPDIFKALSNRAAKKWIWNIDVITKEEHETLKYEYSKIKKENLIITENDAFYQNSLQQKDKVLASKEIILSEREQIIKELREDIKHFTGIYKNVPLLFARSWTKIYLDHNENPQSVFQISNGNYYVRENGQTNIYMLNERSQKKYSTNNDHYYEFDLTGDQGDMYSYKLTIHNAMALSGIETYSAYDKKEIKREIILLKDKSSMQTHPQSDKMEIEIS